MWLKDGDQWQLASLWRHQLSQKSQLTALDSDRRRLLKSFFEIPSGRHVVQLLGDQWSNSLRISSTTLYHGTQSAPKYSYTHTHVCSAVKHLSFDVTSTNIASFPFSHIFLALSSFSPCMLLTHPLSLYLRLSLGLGDYSAGCCPADKAEKNLPPSYISPSAANGCVLRVQEGWKKEEPTGNVPTDAQPSSLFTKSWVVNKIHCRLASHGHEMNRPACVFMLDYCSHRSKRKELSLCECDIMNLLKSDFLFFYILCSVCVYSPGLIQCVLLQQKMPRTSWS